MFNRYRYEAEFYRTLNRIPLDVRMKLDLAGVKISLKDWLAFSFEERTVLCHLPIETDDRLIEAGNAFEGLRVGVSTDPDAHYGPVVNAAHKERIENYIQMCIDEGGELVETGRLWAFAVLDGDRFHTLAKEDGPDFRVTSDPGYRGALNSSALGLCLLAFAPEDVREHLLDTVELERRTPSTLTDRDELRRRVERIRQWFVGRR